MRNRDPKKKQKGQESTIGKIIYGFLLFLPLLAIGVTCGYAIFNKNAKDSYSNDYIYRQYAITTQQQWNNEVVYNFTYKSNYTASSNTGNFNLYYIGLTPQDLNITQIQYDNIAKWQITTANKILLKDSNLIQIASLTLQEGLSFDFRSEFFNALFSVGNITEIVYKQVGLDNVFYYSIDKVQQSPLFNWAENSIIYTTTASTCTALSITTPFIPLLMSYWLIISVIYFLYDIALMLVWIIHRKIHELQESI